MGRERNSDGKMRWDEKGFGWDEMGREGFGWNEMRREGIWLE